MHSCREVDHQMPTRSKFTDTPSSSLWTYCGGDVKNIALTPILVRARCDPDGDLVTWEHKPLSLIKEFKEVISTPRVQHDLPWPHRISNDHTWHNKISHDLTWSHIISHDLMISQDLTWPHMALLPESWVGCFHFVWTPVHLRTLRRRGLGGRLL